MAKKKKSYRVGDLVSQKEGSGTRTAVVTKRYADIKNGLPGYDAVIVSGPREGQPVWGYDSNVTRVQKGKHEIGVLAERGARSRSIAERTSAKTGWLLPAATFLGGVLLGRRTKTS